jgi:hypothetical protein
MERNYNVSIKSLLNSKNISVEGLYANTFKLSNSIYLLPTFIIKKEYRKFYIQFVWVIFKVALAISVHSAIDSQ